MRLISFLLIAFVMVAFGYPTTLNAEAEEQQKKHVLDQSGRTGLLIFSGYYGWWLGVVPYIYYDVDTKDRLVWGPFVGASSSIMLTYLLTKRKNVTQATASIISLGGHLGTWQGIGWAEIADLKTKDVVAVGTLAGLVGIGSGIILSNNIDVPDGHATLVHSSMFWGAWFSLVMGNLGDHEDNVLLRDMLVGSDAFLLIGTAVALQGAPISRKRAHSINASGFGFALLFWLGYFAYASERNEYEFSTSLTAAGVGSLVGIVTGALSFGETDFDSQYSHNHVKSEQGFRFVPQISLLQNLRTRDQFVPSMGFNLSF